MRKITRTEIVDTVWKACDVLRGVIDSSLYKDYLLTLLFLKYVSDTYGGESGDDKENQPFVIPPESSFSYLYTHREQPNIGKLINSALDKLAKANKEMLLGEDGKGMFSHIDFNSRILGETQAKIDIHFAHFRKKYPNKKDKEEKDLELLFNYPDFQKEVMRIIREKKPASVRDLIDFTEKEEEKINNHIPGFFSGFYTNNKTYDLINIENAIHDKSYYEAFLLSEIANFINNNHTAIELTSSQQKIISGLVKKEINNILKRKQLYPESIAAFNLLTHYKFPIEEETLIQLLPYSDVRLRHRDKKKVNWSYHLFNYLIEKIEPGTLFYSILQLLSNENEQKLAPELLTILSEYITQHKIEEGYIPMLHKIKSLQNENDQINTIRPLLSFEEGKDKIKLIYSSLLPDSQMYILKRLSKEYPDEYIWIENQLTPKYKDFPEKRYKEALRLLLRIGNLEALKETHQILKSNLHYFEHHDPVFGHTTSAAINYLIELLYLALKNKRPTEHLDGNMLDALGKISILAKENLDTIVSHLQELIKENENYKFLNYSIRDFTNKYYETNNPTPNIAEALVIYRQVCRCGHSLTHAK